MLGRSLQMMIERLPAGRPPYQRRQLRHVLWFVAVFVLLTHAWYYVWFRDFYVPDSGSYIVPASNLVAGRGFVNAAGEAETVRTPGYPLLIASFLWAGLDLKYLILFQHALAVLIAVATAAFGLQLTKTRWLALATGVALGVDLPMLNLANSVLAEIMFTGVLLMIWRLLWSVDRATGGSRICLVGLLSGAAVLIRPIALFYVIPGSLYLLFVRKRRRVQSVLGFVVTFVVIPFAWSVRNYVEAGYFNLSSISGFTMAVRGAGVLAINDAGSFDDNFVRRENQLKAKACDDIERIERLDCRNVPDAKRAKYESQLGQELVVQHPLTYAKLVLRGAAIMMLGGDAEHVRQLVGRWAVPLVLVVTVPAFLLACVGCVCWWTRNRRFFVLSLLTISYFIGVSAGAEAYSRFRVPVDPLYVILIATGIEAIAKWTWRFARQSRGINRSAISGLTTSRP